MAWHFNCTSEKVSLIFLRLRPFNFVPSVYLQHILLYPYLLITLIGISVSLRKKCLYSELFWSAFSRIRTEYEEIQSISPSFGLNTKRYRVSLLIQSKCGKMRTRITLNTNNFYAVYKMLIHINVSSCHSCPSYFLVSRTKGFCVLLDLLDLHTLGALYFSCGLHTLVLYLLFKIVGFRFKW